MAKINVKYIAHFSIWAGKPEEAIEINERTTVYDVVNRLMIKYPVFNKAIIDEKTGTLDPRNRVALRKAGEWTKNIITSGELGTSLSDGDTLILW